MCLGEIKETLRWSESKIHLEKGLRWHQMMSLYIHVACKKSLDLNIFITKSSHSYCFSRFSRGKSPWRKEQHFLEFLKKRTTSQSIPKIIFEKFSYLWVTIPSDFTPGISGIFGWMVRISEIQQFLDFLKEFPRKFPFHLPHFKSSGSFGWGKSAQNYHFSRLTERREFR